MLTEPFEPQRQLSPKFAQQELERLPTAPPVHWVDLVGAIGRECIPDATIDFLDIGAAVDAFRGLSYSTTTGCPAPCE